jgi:hypothetical protein
MMPITTISSMRVNERSEDRGLRIEDGEDEMRDARFGMRDEEREMRDVRHGGFVRWRTGCGLRVEGAEFTATWQRNAVAGIYIELGWGRKGKRGLIIG